MSDLVSKKINDVDTLVLEQTLNQTLVNDGHVTIDFDTKNTFVDQDIHVDLTVPSAAAPTLDVTDITTNINMGSASNGVYEPVATISGVTNVATAGWAAAGDTAVSESNVKIGKVNQSTLKNGTTAIASGSNVVPAVDSDQTINISEGYEAARTVVVKSMDSADTQKATVSSGNATISSVNISYDSTDDNFDIAATETIPAPGVNTPGFISSTAGTKNSGTATVAATMNKVTVGATVTGDGTVKPVIARTAKDASDSWIDAASGAATTTKPSSGVYVQVDAAGISKSASAVGTVTAAGYGDTAHYGEAAATSITAGSTDADSTYVPIAEGTVASGTAEISSININYNDTGYFDVTGAVDIPAPTVSTAGYVGNSAGILSGATNGATVDTTIAKIGIGATITGDTTYKPVISKNAATNVDASAVTTSQPEAGFYVAVDTAQLSGTINAAASVTSAGYGTTTSGQYTTTNDSEGITVSAADIAYIPVTGATFANAATSGQNYEDISNSAPILISEDYLYINKGYTNNVKISLAQLVPNDAKITASTGAAYILSGQSAYDSDGKLVVGNIPTYSGSYTIG